jgi:hypothetical protein
MVIAIEGGKDFESIAGNVLRVDRSRGGVIFVIWVPIDTWMHAQLRILVERGPCHLVFILVYIFEEREG